jgi:hypothetical protein
MPWRCACLRSNRASPCSRADPDCSRGSGALFRGGNALGVDEPIRHARRPQPSSLTRPIVHGGGDRRLRRPRAPARPTMHAVQPDHGCRPAGRPSPASVTAISVDPDGTIRPPRQRPPSSSTAPWPTSTTGAVAIDGPHRRAGPATPSRSTRPVVQPDSAHRHARRPHSTSWSTIAVTLDGAPGPRGRWVSYNPRVVSMHVHDPLPPLQSTRAPLQGPSASSRRPPAKACKEGRPARPGCEAWLPGRGESDARTGLLQGKGTTHADQRASASGRMTPVLRSRGRRPINARRSPSTARPRGVAPRRG